MSVERATIAFAGLMVLLSVALTIWINDNFIWFTVFIGANLLQSAYTQFCPAAIILCKIGFQSEAQLATAEH
ncbi:YgaP family membrane protein [Shewanella pneumatophori]|uniref:DUF2892 domain-containing protein n=1 Tax=Shewanella pneumatophori TaxID=314092 RepID=A0A9X1ZBI9_9GAMM|nr:DUF2892 domain-containing protein [Shewanella pneumatophori]MCL1139209.1 DUF2892 domain-containing protein [Shewanella pneumatophori]